MNKKLIVIESIVHDVHAACISWALKEKGHNVEILYGNDFPTQLDISIYPEKGRIVYTTDEKELVLTADDKFTYWARRCGQPFLGDSIHSADRAVVQRECNNLIASAREMICSWPGVFSVNTITSKRRNNYKALQLEIAAGLGFPTPDTLMSSFPKLVRAFGKVYSNRLSYKLHDPAIWKSSESVTLAYNHLINDLDLVTDDEIASSPAIFQQYIDKKYESRVLVFGRNCYGSKIDSQINDKAEVDWRAGQDNLDIEMMDVPRYVQEFCFKFMEKMEIVFGCFDFIISESLGWVFLECNEQGQWAWQESNSPDLPLIDAVSEFLISGQSSYSYNQDSQRSPLKYQDYHTHWEQEGLDIYRKHVNPPSTFEGHE